MTGTSVQQRTLDVHPARALVTTPSVAGTNISNVAPMKFQLYKKKQNEMKNTSSPCAV